MTTIETNTICGSDALPVDLDTLLKELTDLRGSDLHFVAGEPPVFRVDGKLIRRANGPILDAEALASLLLQPLTEEQQAALETRQDVELSLRRGGFTFRYHVFREQGRLSASVRVAPTKVPTLADLGLTGDAVPAIDGQSVLQWLTKQPRGLVLVVGNTGSGKSTTIAAMIEEINQTRAERIQTIENQVEYVFQPQQSVITQRNVGEDVIDFPAGLRAVLRSDPDVVLVGEPRDLETMALTLALAETGHLVFTILHVDTASEAIRRIVDAFPEGQRLPIQRMLARSLLAVIAQRLIPRKGRSGRIAVQEVLIATPRIRRMILEGQTDFTIAIEAGHKDGMQTMDDAVAKSYERGDISYEQALYQLEDKERIQPPAEA